MRVINDKNEKGETSQPLDWFAVFAQGLMTTFGFKSFIFTPFAILGGYARMPEPWPKVSALIGAILAVLFFEVHPLIVIILFVFSLFVADSAWKEVEFPKLMLLSVLISLAALGGVLLYQSEMHGLPVGEYVRQKATQLSENSVAMQKNFGLSGEVKTIRDQVLFLGPFVYVSVMLLTLFLSIGCASHLGWFPENHPYSGSKFRGFKFPAWLSVAFVVLMFLAGPMVNPKVEYIAAGILYLVGTFMFMQGMLALSRYFAFRQFQARSRTVLYSLATIPCFFFTVALGVLNPLLARRASRLEELK